MSALDKIDIYGQIGDLKEVDYRNTLAIATLIELLVDKGLISRQEFAKKAHELDTTTTEEAKNMRVINR